MASASPTNYFEMTFDAPANTGYRIWLRAKATSDSWANDSVYIQFSDSADAASTPKYLIGTSDATWFSLEQCSGCGVAGWGWEDNGWGTPATMGPLIYFTTNGTHRIRIQPREDGVAIDQIVLSANPQTYLNVAPGANKNDQTIVP